MRRVKGWTSSTIVLGLVLAGLAVSPSASAVPDDAPVGSAGVAGGAAKLSGKAYALSVAKSARKSAAKSLWSVPPISTTGGATIFVPAKRARWFAGASGTLVDITWESERDTGGDLPETVRVVSAQLRKQLTRRGFTKVYSAGNDSHFWVYESRRYVCQVDRSKIGCVSKSEAKKALARVTPYYKALPAKERYARMSIVLDRVEKGGVKGYFKRLATISVPGGRSDYVGLYYKAPRGRWTYVTGMQDFPMCSVFEKSKGARRAYAGFPCYRGSYDNFSAVRR